MASAVAAGSSAAESAPSTNTAVTTPLQLLDQSIGKRLLVILKNDRELEGTLIGVDDLVNMVMEDVIEYVMDPATGVSKEAGKVDEILLNGNNVVMMVPGGRPKKE